MLESQRDQLHEDLRRPRYPRSGWIGVGFDGTLAKTCPHDRADAIGEALQPMLRRVRHWIRSGRTVKIVTPRAGDAFQEHSIRQWCLRQRLPELAITDRIDEKMIAFWDARSVGVLPDLGYPVLPRPLTWWQRLRMRLSSAFRAAAMMGADESFYEDHQLPAARASSAMLRQEPVLPQLATLPPPPEKWLILEK